MDGYYNSLLSFIDKAVEEGFISPTARHIIVSAPTAKELVKKMEVKLIYIFLFSSFFLNCPFGSKSFYSLLGHRNERKENIVWIIDQI